VQHAPSTSALVGGSGGFCRSVGRLWVRLRNSVRLQAQMRNVPVQRLLLPVEHYKLRPAEDQGSAGQVRRHQLRKCTREHANTIFISLLQHYYRALVLLAHPSKIFICADLGCVSTKNVLHGMRYVMHAF
jgi:hypothetical protein